MGSLERDRIMYRLWKEYRLSFRQIADLFLVRSQAVVAGIKRYQDFLRAADTAHPERKQDP